MTTEQAIKHKDAIKWWTDNTDKGVWIGSYSTEGWTLDFNPQFVMHMKYVQNDKYAELRMAQADGKIIQRSVTMPRDNGWKDYEDIFEGNHIDQFRIKPDEPKFKAGDYVRHAKIHKISHFLSNHRLQTEDDFEFELDEVQLWEPREGDVVIDLDSGMIGIVESLDILEVKLRNIRGFFFNTKKEYCIPYIGQPFKEMK